MKSPDRTTTFEQFCHQDATLPKRKSSVAKQPVIQPVFFAVTDDEPFETSRRFAARLEDAIEHAFDSQSYCPNCVHGNNFHTDDFKHWEITDCLWCDPERLERK